MGKDEQLTHSLKELGGGYLFKGVGSAAIQLRLHSIQPLQEGRLGSSEKVVREARGRHHLLPQMSPRSLHNRSEVRAPPSRIRLDFNVRECTERSRREAETSIFV